MSFINRNGIEGMKREEMINHMITSHNAYYEEEVKKHPSYEIVVRMISQANEKINFLIETYSDGFDFTKAEEMNVIVRCKKNTSILNGKIGVIVSLAKTNISVSFNCLKTPSCYYEVKISKVSLITLPCNQLVNLLNKATVFFKTHAYFLPIIYENYICNLNECKGSKLPDSFDDEAMLNQLDELPNSFDDEAMLNQLDVMSIQEPEKMTDCNTNTSPIPCLYSLTTLVEGTNLHTKDSVSNTSNFIKKNAAHQGVIESACLRINIPYDIDFFNDGLNEAQKFFVLESMKKSPLKLIGPPGTGKTSTIIEMICQFLKRGETVLVCGPTNTTIDNIITRFIQTSYYEANNTSFYRNGSEIKGLIKYNIKNQLDELSRKNKKHEHIHILTKQIQNAQVVFSTLISSTRLSTTFDMCIVDEACQASQLECFMGVVKAKSFVLVGDPNQLCAPSTSFYQHLNIQTHVLDVQYRMPPSLFKFSNTYFYGSLITSPIVETFFFLDKNNILFIDTKDDGRDEKKRKSSIINKHESCIAIKITRWLERTGNRDIGLLAPYAGQICLFKNAIYQIYGIPRHPYQLISPKYEVIKIKSSSCTISVGTIDSFQGQENDVIVLSLVRSNKKQKIGFLSDIKRVNVALTRCKKGVIIIGNSETFAKVSFYNLLFAFLQQEGLVMSNKEISNVTTNI